MTVAVGISELRELIKTYNNGVEKPIWATEFGLVGIQSDAERYYSATYLAQIAILMLSQNVERMYYYVNMDDGNFPYLGLFSSGDDPLGAFRPHPPLIAYATLIRQLSGATYQDRFNTSKSTYAFRFQRGSEQVIALWANYYPVVVSLATNSNVVVTNIMGGTETKSPVSGEVLYYPQQKCSVCDWIGVIRHRSRQQSGSRFSFWLFKDPRRKRMVLRIRRPE